jgi:hypothetical protein
VVGVLLLFLQLVDGLSLGDLFLLVLGRRGHDGRGAGEGGGGMNVGMRQDQG